MPSPAQAAQYVACTYEHVSGDMLFLVDNVKAEIEKGGRFSR